MITITEEEYNNLMMTQMKWNALDQAIGEFYKTDIPDDEGGDLCDIGEIAASAFGYL